MGDNPLRTNEDNEPSAQKSLIITRKKKETLSKEQQTFNRLVKRIEKLQADLEKKTDCLQQKLDFYGKHIYPLDQRQIALYKDLTKCLYGFFKEDFLFSKYDKEILGEIISIQLQNLFQIDQNEPDDLLKEIFKAVEHRDFDEAAEEEIDLMKEEIQSMFSEMGMDYNVNDLHHKMTQEEILKRMEELHQQFQQRSASQGSIPKRKTKKQLEKEAAEKRLEEAKVKSINSIYKQLVKIFHPDLEQDPDLKLEKEELMKKLTTSYKRGDLHTLLQLELQWIQKAGTHIDKLSDEKLVLYNESLKQQITDLENEINELLHHPRYQPLHSFVIKPDQMMYIPMNDIKQQKKSLIQEMARSVLALQGNQNRALVEIRQIIHSFKNQE